MVIYIFYEIFRKLEEWNENISIELFFKFEFDRRIEFIMFVLMYFLEIWDVMMFEIKFLFFFVIVN